MTKFDLTFHLPLMNAAGSLGFAPDLRGPVDLKRFGAFVTNPVSLYPRTPAVSRCCLAFPGGFLLHTGYPNPGLDVVLRRYATRWARSPLPVIVHLLCRDPGEVSRMAARLEGMEGVMGLEISLPPGQGVAITSLLANAQAELPLILRLPLDQAASLASTLSGPDALAGLAAFSLGPPRGALPGQDVRLVEGRLYGPALFPQALGAVKALVQAGLPVIAAGGVYHPGQVDTLIASGALAVQLDSVLWRGGLSNPF